MRSVFIFTVYLLFFLFVYSLLFGEVGQGTLTIGVGMAIVVALEGEIND